jgi:hypothetical protein
LSHHVTGSWSALLLHDLQVAAAAIHRTLQEAGWFCVFACKLVDLQQLAVAAASAAVVAAAGRTAASAIVAAIFGVQQRACGLQQQLDRTALHVGAAAFGHCKKCTGLCLFDSLLIKLRS